MGMKGSLSGSWAMTYYTRNRRFPSYNEDAWMSNRLAHPISLLTPTLSSGMTTHMAYSLTRSSKSSFGSETP